MGHFQDGEHGSPDDDNDDDDDGGDDHVAVVAVGSCLPRYYITVNG